MHVKVNSSVFLDPFSNYIYKYNTFPISTLSLHLSLFLTTCVCVCVCVYKIYSHSAPVDLSFSESTLGSTYDLSIPRVADDRHDRSSCPCLPNATTGDVQIRVRGKNTHILTHAHLTTIKLGLPFQG